MKHIHTWRQSWITETLEVCHERGRRQLAGESPRTENDAAAKGTAVHSGIEHSVNYFLNFGEYLPLADTVELGIQTFDHISEMPKFEWKKLKSRNTVHQHIAKMLTDWENEVKPTLKPVRTEIKFGPILLYSDEVREIWLEGMADHEDEENPHYKDYKTSAREYEEWKYKRWNKQSTQYLYERALRLNRLDESHDFEFIVMFPYEDKGVQRFTVTRGPQHFEWYKEQLVSLAVLVEAQLPVWPKHDSSSLCSQLWCPAWDDCKGRHFSEV